MADFEHFYLEREPLSGISAKTIRTMAMVTMFGPAITSEAQTLRRDKPEMTELEITASAVHSAVSSILLRRFPQATERRGIDHALDEFDDGYGMRDGFPVPNVYSGKTYYQHRADTIHAAWKVHRQNMVDSRYTVTLGQAVGTLLPYIDAVDEQTKTMFTANFPNYLTRAFGNVWSMLLEQDTHWEHFSGVMDYIHLASDYGRSRTIPEASEGDCFNLNYVMTEADVRRVISEPIARAFVANMKENGTLKNGSLRAAVV